MSEKKTIAFLVKVFDCNKQQWITYVCRISDKAILAKSDYCNSVKETLASIEEKRNGKRTSR